MRTSSRIIATIAALAALSVVSVGPAAAVGPASSSGVAHIARSCGSVGGQYGGGEEGGAGVRITFVRGVSCRHARRVLKRCISHFHVKGWFGHAREGDTVRAWLTGGPGKKIVFVGTAGGAPHCLSAALTRIGY